MEFCFILGINLEKIRNLPFYVHCKNPDSQSYMWQPYDKYNFIVPFYRLENWSSEKLRNLLNISLVSDRVQAIHHYDTDLLSLKKHQMMERCLFLLPLAPSTLRHYCFFPLVSRVQWLNISGFEVGLHSKWHLQLPLLSAAPGPPSCLFPSRSAPTFTCFPLSWGI